uniref:Uncharacterized protein n=1 Tax=Arundo donax TaxID=35708 RepID=A0A0A9BV61_ARUDO
MQCSGAARGDRGVANTVIPRRPHEVMSDYKRKHPFSADLCENEQGYESLD